MRLIDIDDDRNCFCGNDGEYEKWNIDPDVLKDAITIEPEQRWIPVMERMPEEDYSTGRGVQHSASVLVTIVHHANDDYVFVDMACTVDGDWQLTYPIDDDPDIPKWCEIIAWMPLPEPYRSKA